MSDMEKIRQLLAEARGMDEFDYASLSTGAVGSILQAILDLDERTKAAPVESTEKTCRTCRFWIRSGYPDNEHSRRVSQADCFLEPPKLSSLHGGTVRPHTNAQDLCGRWEHDGVDPEAADAEGIDRLGVACWRPSPTSNEGGSR